MGGGRNPSKKFYDYKKTIKNKQVKNCFNCKYNEMNNFFNYKCTKNNFLLENVKNTICNNFEENNTFKRKRECGFRKIK